MPNETQSLAGLGEIAAKLDGAGIQWALFAGAAASVYGAERAITDVDILVPHGEAQRLLELLPEAELAYSEPGLTHLALPGVDLLAGMGAVDLDAPMGARLTRHDIGEILVPVIPREDNILLKAVWGRGADQGKHDWEDVEAMMAEAPSLDWQYLRWRATTLDEPELLPEIMERLAALWRQLHGKEEEGQDG
jgi:hypothetical protein